jgi:D-lactate dehydrogenase (cytochrome)
MMLPDQIYPLNSSSSPYYALLETQGAREDHDMQKLESYLEKNMTNGVIQDGVLAQDASQVNELWQWREKIPEAITRSGPAMTYDVAMDIRLFPRMVQDVKTKFPLGKSQYSNILGFGHIGDGVKTISVIG